MDLTIVITSMSRPEKLIRVIDHLERSNFLGTILIGDASLQQSRKPVSDRLKRSKLKSVYLNHEGLSVYASHQILASKIETTFSVCIADGGLLIPESLEQCISFLTSNPDFVAVAGQSYLFLMSGNSKLRWIGWNQFPELLHDDASARFNQICHNYVVPMYCVMHSKYWTRIWLNTESIPDQSFSSEIIPAMRLSIIGKIKSLPIPYLLREIHEKRTKLVSGKDYKNLSNFKETLLACRIILEDEFRYNSKIVNQIFIAQSFDYFLEKQSSRKYFTTRVRAYFFKTVSRFLHQIRIVAIISLRYKIRAEIKKFQWNGQEKKAFLDILSFVDRS